MNWTSVIKDDCKMWERSDGVVVHGYQIEAIECAEKEAHEANVKRMQEKREQWHAEIEDVPEEQPREMSGLDFVVTGVLLIIALVMIFR